MMIKRVCAMLLALVMCTGVFSTTAFAYSNETVSAADVTEATEPEETESAEEQPKESEDELPYNFTITEDGTIVFSFNGEEYEYDMDSEESQTTGKVVTGGSRLNVRTGAGMNYEIIDQLRPGEEVVVIGTEGDWYQITVPEKTGYVHGDYLEILEAAEENSEMDMALIMMFMSMFMLFEPYYPLTLETDKKGNAVPSKKYSSLHNPVCGYSKSNSDSFLDSRFPENFYTKGYIKRLRKCHGKVIRELNEVLKTALRSVYKELHADRETGC